MEKGKGHREIHRTADFFMGASSPDGFFSFYDELKAPREGARSYLIKGGAGTGKSGIIKKVFNSFADKEDIIERIHCASDPNSFDGVVLHKARCSVVDATAPHIIEPSYPGGYETVINLCEFFDEKKLEGRLEKIIFYQNENSLCHQKCQRLIRCASILIDDNKRFVEAVTDFEKISLTAGRLSKQLFQKQDKKAESNKRFLSAVTNQGLCCYEETINSLCDTVIAFEDDFGVASAVFLKEVAQYLDAMGYTAFYCYCPLDPKNKLEHIIIPSLSLGFITKNRFHSFQGVIPTKTIHFTRFTDMVPIRERKQALKFNRRAAGALLSSGVEVLEQAKRIHDSLEEQYIDAVDFSRVDQKTAELISSIGLRY